MASRTDPAVAALVQQLAAPLRFQVEALRKCILAASPAIREEVKWNAPSFRTSEHFATMNVRTPGRLRLVLHTGARKRAAPARPPVADPRGLLEWLDDDRCLMSFGSLQEVRDQGPALQDIVRAWLQRLPPEGPAPAARRRAAARRRPGR